MIGKYEEKRQEENLQHKQCHKHSAYFMEVEEKQQKVKEKESKY